MKRTEDYVCGWTEKQPLCLFTCSAAAPRFPVNLSDNVKNSLQQQIACTDRERL